MSLVTSLNEMSDEQMNKVNKELKIKLDDKYSFGPPRYMIPYDISDQDEVKLPFAFAKNKLKLQRRNRNTFEQTDVDFMGELRDEQRIVKKEAIQILNKTGSVILSMYCGFGKTRSR